MFHLEHLVEIDVIVFAVESDDLWSRLPIDVAAVTGHVYMRVRQTNPR